MNTNSENKDALSGGLSVGSNSPPVNLARYNGRPLAASKMEISEDELTSIIKDIMVFDAMSGLIADFTPEEMEIFDAAVAGR